MGEYMSVQWNIELVKEYANEYGYTVLSEEYANNKHPLKILCPDGHEFRMRWENFRRGARCLECSRILQGNRQRRSLDDVSELFLEYGYILLSEEYRNSNEKLDLLCPNGHNIEMRWGDFQQGHRCNICHNESRKLKISDIRARVDEIGFNLVSKNNVQTDGLLKFSCPSGHIFEKTWTGFLSVKYKCPQCFERIIRKGGRKNGYFGKRTIADVREHVENNGDILLSSEYFGAHEKLKIMCPDGHQFDITWSSYQQGNGCPHHNVSSKGEDRVSKVLQYYNVEFDTQARFDGCKNQNHLPFDFYLPDYNTCIEINGKQHFESVEFFGGKKQLKLQKKHDKIKREFCKESGIKLIEIPYWDFENIEKILTKQLRL